MMEMIPKEVIDAYEKSDSYKELKRHFGEWRNLLDEYYRKYSVMESYLKEETEKRKDHEKYAKGGLGTHRGVLCPSNMETFLVSNVKRGRFVKSDKEPDYIYHYDKDDILISCVNFDGPIKNTEYVVWEDCNTQVGIKYFPEDEELDYIAIASYDDDQKLVRYVFGGFNFQKATTLIGEKYIYQDDKVYVTWIDGVDDSVSGQHIVLYLDERRVATRYTRCWDMNQEEVFEGIPKYKLVF